MSLAGSLVSGWMPSCSDNDDVDISNISYPVKLSDDLPISSPALSRTSSLDSYSAHVMSFDQSPPSPGSSEDHPDTYRTDSPVGPLSSSDRRAIRNRMRDPGWVPRPRNAFIIFRCEYSRKHARDSSDGSDNKSTDKTLSKRAGEEWRRLSDEERQKYHIRASEEKAAHSSQNPDYRFKPVRHPPPGSPPTLERAQPMAGATIAAHSEVDDSPLYTPVVPASPMLHGLQFGSQITPLHEYQLSLLDEATDCSIDMNGSQYSSMSFGVSAGAYSYTDPSSNIYQQFSFADANTYPPLLDTTSPFADWACATTTSESCSTLAGAVAPSAHIPKATDTGVSGLSGPPPLPIPFTLQHVPSTLDEIPATLWGADYTQVATPGLAAFGGVPGAVPSGAAGYEVAAEASFNEFINAL
ncbi:hypothetical protein BC834DRAFT_1042660 [Gloeopeniophorella convolvens]|nr:hypothetical protein BC834DRAFT_1042660 [Gloeopeniophorella convolvens]